MSNKDKGLSEPVLRFPEFRGTKGWEKARLIDTADRSVKWSFIGGPFGSNLKSSDYVEDGVRILQLQNIGDGEFFDDYRIFTTVEKADELLSNNIYPGDIIMSKMGDPVGRACLIPNQHDRYVMCSDGIRLVVDEKSHDKYFVYSLINSPLFRSTIEKTATGSTRKRIGLDELKNLPMRLPARAEQQEIANCLSSLDELIAAQARKVDALKTHKKGLMQQLFPREGKTQPRLRFPEFLDTGEWKKNTLGDLVEIRSGSSPSEYELHADGKHPFVKVEDLNNCEKYQVAAREYSNDIDGLVPLNSVIFPKRGAAIALNKLRLANRDLLMDTNMMALTPNDACHADFLFHYLSQIGLDRIADNSTIPQINNKHIIPFRVLVPIPKEQQRISDCLTSLDDLITAGIQQLETLETHKKGLMQQLFPSMEEVV